MCPFPYKRLTLPAIRNRGVGGEGFVAFSRRFLTKITLPAISLRDLEKDG
jgi:hypothetical protein